MTKPTAVNRMATTAGSMACLCALSSISVAAGVPPPPGSNTRTGPDTSKSLGIVTALSVRDVLGDVSFKWDGQDAVPDPQGAFVDAANLSALIRADARAVPLPWGSKGALIQNAFILSSLDVAPDDTWRCMSHRDLSGNAHIRIYGAFCDASGSPAPPYHIDASGRLVLLYEHFDGLDTAGAARASVATMLGIPSPTNESDVPQLICGPAFAQLGAVPEDRGSGVSVTTDNALIFRDPGIGLKGAHSIAFAQLEGVWWRATDPLSTFVRTLVLRRARDAGMQALVFATVHDDSTAQGGITEALLLYRSSPAQEAPIYASSDAPDAMTIVDPDAQQLAASADGSSFVYSKPLLGPSGADRASLAGRILFPALAWSSSVPMNIDACEMNNNMKSASIPLRIMQLWRAQQHAITSGQTDPSGLGMFDVGGIVGLDDAVQRIADAAATSVASYFADPTNILKLAQSIDAVYPGLLRTRGASGVVLSRAFTSQMDLAMDIQLTFDVEYEGTSVSQIPCTLQLRSDPGRSSGYIGYAATLTQYLDAAMNLVDYSGASPSSDVNNAFPWRTDPSWASAAVIVASVRMSSH